MKDLFCNEKPVDALIEIYRNAQRKDYTYSSEVSKKIDTPYAHTVKLVKKMKELELVESREEGRKKYLEPTEKGEKIAPILVELKQELDPTQKSELEVNS